MKMSEPKQEKLKKYFESISYGIDASKKVWEKDPEKLQLWESSLSSPLSYTPQDFRYLIHGVHEEGSIVRTMQMIHLLTREIEGAQVIGEKIDLLRNPEKLAEKPTISCSLIDQNHRNTWAPGGLILNVPLENILKTCSQDCGNNFANSGNHLDELYKEREKYGIADPQTLLDATHPLIYNEVVVAGTGREGKKVGLSGVFIKNLPGGAAVDEGLARTLTSLAWSRKLPIVQIMESFMQFKDSNPEFSDTYLAFNLGGVRYLFSEDRFSYLEFGGKKSRPMNTGERKFMVDEVEKYSRRENNPRLKE